MSLCYCHMRLSFTNISSRNALLGEGCNGSNNHDSEISASMGDKMMSLGKKEKCHNVSSKFMIPIKEKYINEYCLIKFYN